MKYQWAIRGAIRGAIRVGLLGLLAVAANSARCQSVALQGVLTGTAGQPLPGARAWSVQFYDSATTGSALGAPVTGTVNVAASGRWTIALSPPAQVLNASGDVYYQLGIDSAITPDGVIDAGDFFTGRVRVSGVLLAQSAQKLRGEHFVMVSASGDPAANGAALFAAYEAAKNMNPSATSPVAVIVPPGQFDLGTSALLLNVSYIYLEGLTSGRETQHIYGTANGAGTGVVEQTADNIIIENLSLECTLSDYNGPEDSSQPTAYFPNVIWNSGGAHNGSSPNTTIRNCLFLADDTNAHGMRFGIEYAGTYENCTAGAYAFGGLNGMASGKFLRCTGGDESFASSFSVSVNGTIAATGLFDTCAGGNLSFGGNVVASGKFINCTATGSSDFGGEGLASGSFDHCSVGQGQLCFGGNGTASGTFNYCTAGDDSFGGALGIAGIASGKFSYCIGGANCFGGTGLTQIGTASGTFESCQGGAKSFGGGTNGTAGGGKFYRCTGGAGSFTQAGTATPIHIFCIVNGARYANND